MSNEGEYFLRGKYNRALNRIAELEEELRSAGSATRQAETSTDEELEARDSALLQRRVFSLEQQLERVTAERDTALARLAPREAEGEYAGENNFPKKTQSSREVESRLDIDAKIEAALTRIDQWALEIKTEVISLRTMKASNAAE